MGTLKPQEPLAQAALMLALIFCRTSGGSFLPILDCRIFSRVSGEYCLPSAKARILARVSGEGEYPRR